MKKLTDKIRNVFTDDLIIPLMITVYGATITVGIATGISYALHHSPFEDSNRIEYKIENPINF